MSHRDDLPTWITLGPDYAPRERRQIVVRVSDIVAAVCLLLALAFAVGVAARHTAEADRALQRALAESAAMPEGWVPLCATEAECAVLAHEFERRAPEFAP